MDSWSLKIESRCSHYEGEAALAVFSSLCCFQTLFDCFPVSAWSGPGLFDGVLFLDAVTCALLPWVPWSSHLVGLLRLVSVHSLLHVRMLGTCFHLISAFKPSVRSSRLSFSILFLNSSLTLRLLVSCLFLCWPCFEIFLRKHLKIVYNNNNSVLCGFQLILKPYHIAVFSVELIAPDEEGTFSAEVIFETQFEVWHFILEKYINQILWL